MIKVSLVLEQFVPDTLLLIQKDIEKTAEKGDIHPSEIVVPVLSGSDTLWVAFDDRILGFTTVRIEERPSGLYLLWFATGGEAGASWLPEMESTLSRYAKEQGCVGMRMHGRLGWLPHLKKRGWRATRAEMMRDI